MNLEMRRDLVLAADSDAKVARDLSESFGELNLDIAAALSGKEAWKMALELRPKIIVLETELADMSGFDLCKRLSSHAKTEKIPFIFYTGNDAEIDVVVGFELGAADYVSKTVSAREVALRVQAILKRVMPEGTSGLIRVGKMLLDLDQAVGTQDGRRLSLSPTEFQILAALAKADGRVLSRAEIVSAVWSREARVMGRTVDAHVKSLRAKLSDEGFGIVTVRGIGYCLRNGADGAPRPGSDNRYLNSKSHQDERGLTAMKKPNMACRIESGR